MVCGFHGHLCRGGFKLNGTKESAMLFKWQELPSATLVDLPWPSSHEVETESRSLMAEPPVRYDTRADTSARCQIAGLSGFRWKPRGRMAALLK